MKTGRPRRAVRSVCRRRACADGGRPVDRLSELLGQHVQFAYTSLDRIVLNGYIDRLQRPAGLVAFVHEVVGIRCIEPAVLASRTERYRSWVRAETAARGIPVLPAPKGPRKEDPPLPP